MVEVKYFAQRSYLPVSKRLLMCNHIGMKKSYSEKGRDITKEKCITSDDNLCLLQLHANTVIKGESGLITFSSVMDDYCKYSELILALDVIKHCETSRSFPPPQPTYNFISNHSTPSRSDIDCSLNDSSIVKY